MMEEETLGELSGMPTPFWGVSDDEEGVASFLKGAEEEQSGLAEVVVKGAGVPGNAAVAVLTAEAAVEDMSVPEGIKGSALTLRVDATVAGAGGGGLVEGVKAGSGALFEGLEAEGGCQAGMAVSIGMDLVRDAVATEGVLVMGVVV